MLLDRLFKFIEVEDDTQVNPVLAGYFSKIVQLLINRKQKQVVPYIVSDEYNVVENLLKHVYSRSVAEVIQRLLHIVDSNFEDELSAKISQKKQIILASLIEQLATKREDETVMNAAFILQDILEQKPFFQILTKRQNMQKMFEIAFDTTAPDTDSCFVTQGLISRFVQQFNDRWKQSLDENRFDNSCDDDDIIVNEMSDEENEESKSKHADAVVELLVKMIEPIKTILETSPLPEIQSSFSSKRTMPLGRTKLRAVELLQSIVSLRKAEIINVVTSSEVLQVAIGLIEKHPWNNMIQLKAHLIFEDVLYSDITVDEKISFLKSSDATKMLMQMAQEPDVTFNSGNKIRNGFMGFVIKLANLIVKVKTMVAEGMDLEQVYTSGWDSFVSGELETSNERNGRNLGGRPTSTTDEDDENNQFDVNMDNIMKRFKCFNTIMQNNSSTDDDDKEDEEDTNEPDREEDADGENRAAPAEIKKIEVVLPEQSQVDSKYADAGYWKVDANIDELDDLLADYE